MDERISATVIRALLTATLVASSGAGCSSSSVKCESAALIRLHFNQPAQNCRVNIFPAGADGGISDGGTLASVPSYQFASSAGGSGNCPNLDIVPPKSSTVVCDVVEGPGPTSCEASSGCFTLTFWGAAGTALRAAIGSQTFDAFLVCNGVVVDQSTFDPAAPANQIYCRDVSSGAITH
jgi:hypothetical protein